MNKDKVDYEQRQSGEKTKGYLVVQQILNEGVHCIASVV